MKKKIKSHVVLLVALVFISGCSKNENNEEAGLRGPLVKDLPVEEIGSTDGGPQNSPIQAVGYYADGLLKNSLRIPDVGESFIKVFRLRDRGYSTDLLFWILEHSADSVSKQFPKSERLQIGDMSDIDGGQLSRHASHQNGLDVDGAYYRVNRREMNPEGFGGFDEVFVTKGMVTKNFDIARNFHFFDAAVATGQVARIFVDAAIKVSMCEFAQKLKPGSALSKRSTETLRRLRPLTNHADHFHVRAKCPTTSPDCQTQAEVPEGSGCPKPGQTLLNSFSYEED